MDFTIEQGPLKSKIFGKTNVSGLNRFIERNSELEIPTNTNINNEQIDKITDEFENICRNAVSKYVPTTKIENKKYLSKTTKKLLRESKRLQRLLFRGGPLLNDQFRNGLLVKIRQLKQMANNNINSENSKFFTNMYDSVGNTRDAFKLVGKYTGLKQYHSPSNGLFTDENKNTFISGGENIANELGEQFQNNHKQTLDNTSVHCDSVNRDNAIIDRFSSGIIFDNTHTTLNYGNEKNPHENKNLLTYAGELDGIIQMRPNKKSTGRDTMPYTLIKTFTPNIILFLVTLFNHCIANCHFPSNWKHSVVIPIHKSGKNKECTTGWRPISQLSCISKIFEKVLMARISDIVNGLDIFADQFGFLNGNSTEHALAILQSDIDNGLNRKKITSIVALDLRAAFDIIWPEGLIRDVKNGNHDYD